LCSHSVFEDQYQNIEIISALSKTKKFTQEGVEEMEQVLDGLNNWGRQSNVKRLDKIT
jgi:hypothetical protein